MMYRCVSQVTLYCLMSGLSVFRVFGLAVAATAFLSSCASFSDVQMSAPTVEFDSTVSTVRLSNCVEQQLKTVWKANHIHVKNAGLEYAYYVGDRKPTLVGGGVNLTVTIKARNNTNRVSLREAPHISIGSAYKDTREAIRFCATDEFAWTVAENWAPEKQWPPININTTDLHIKKKVGTRICRLRSNGWEAVGVVERVADPKVLIRISSLRQGSRKQGLEKDILFWDYPEIWNRC